MENHVVVIFDDDGTPEGTETFRTAEEAAAFCFGYGAGAGDYGGCGYAMTGEDLARDLELAMSANPAKALALNKMISKAKRK